MKNDDEMPEGWETGTIHLDPIPGYWKPVKFIVKGWYINHCREPNIHRLIKNGNALAIKFFDKEETYKPVDTSLPQVLPPKSVRKHRVNQAKGGPRAFKQMRSEVYDW